MSVIVPPIPTNFIVQQGNGNVFASWDLISGSTSYKLQRSTDNVTFTTLATPTLTNYLDITATQGTLYFYKVAATNGAGDSPFTIAQSVVPAQSGKLSLGQIRLMAQQRADKVNSSFVTVSEWNSYINQSYYELYDMLTTLYEDYYAEQPVLFQTIGSQSQYNLPDGTNTFLNALGVSITPRPFFKLLGVDMGVSLTNNAWFTLHKFNFIQRNDFIYPSTPSPFLGVFNPAYRLLGDTIDFIPTPSAGQYIRLWYIHRLKTLLQDTDICEGVSGWTEYIIVDAAIKAIQKEEGDVSVLAAQKMMLIDRIQATAMNRDAGAPDTISDTRSFRSGRGSYGGFSGDGGFGGY